VLQRHFGLTSREAEVLFWIAQGKRNPEIAVILANTTGTAKKQSASVLENSTPKTASPPPKLPTRSSPPAP